MVVRSANDLTLFWFEELVDLAFSGGGRAGRSVALWCFYYGGALMGLFRRTIVTYWWTLPSYHSSIIVDLLPVVPVPACIMQAVHYYFTSFLVLRSAADGRTIPLRLGYCACHLPA